MIGLACTGVMGETEISSPDTAWVLCAIVGQTIWSSRFVVQWYHSEQIGFSHFPPSFWWLSLGGNSLLLAYAFHVSDPVFVAGLALGPVVQVRNLILAGAAETAPSSLRARAQLAG